MSEQNMPAELPGWVADHVKLYLEDPDNAHMWDSAPVGGPGVLPTLLLTTIGRKSGEPRMLPLIYQKVDAGFVIIASKGGAPSHPAWFLNLIDRPNCEIRVGRDFHRVTARVSEGEERAELWKIMVEVYAPYENYQASTDREIPVVVLEPGG
jgi:deazaflavin-dependent oxidoreductase (nitroreductase family)